MQPSEPDFYETLFKGVVAGIGVVGWWLLRTVFGDLKDIHKKIESHHNEAKADMSNHAVKSAEQYPTRSELASVRLETLDSLKRVHDRIDEGNKAREENYRVTSADLGELKNLIIGGKRDE